MAWKAPLHKKGDLAWEYVAMMIIGLIVLLIIIIFSKTLKEKIVEGIAYFTTKILGR